MLLLLGYASGPIENRPLAPAPHWRLSWSAVEELSRYATDRLPLRRRAVTVNALVSSRLFHEAPTTGSRGIPDVPGVSGLQPQPTDVSPGAAAVVIGQGGWLYLSEDFLNECNRGQPPAQVIAGLTRLQRILAASGRRFVFTLAPDKSTAVPEYLPATYPSKDCSAFSKRETFDLLQASAIPGYIDMRQLIGARQALEHRPYYMRKDSHWNGLATAMLSLETARRLDTRLLDGTSTPERLSTYTGDLTTLLGLPAQDQTVTADVIREGVSSSPLMEAPLVRGVVATRATSQSRSAFLLPGRTLLVGDSFMKDSIAQLAPLFTDVTAVENGDVRKAPAVMAQQVQVARTIVLVWSERYFTDPNQGAFWSAPFLDRLESSLSSK